MKKEVLIWILFVVVIFVVVTIIIATVTMNESRKGYIKLSDVQNHTETICIASYPRTTILECPCDNMNNTRCQKSPILKVATNNLARDYEGFILQGGCRIANVTFEQKVSVYDCNLNVSDQFISTLELNLTLR